MVSSLRYTVYKLFGEIDYLHYYRRMIKDFEKGQWNFDIRSIVKNIKMSLRCPKYVCKKGFSKRLCLTIINDELFKQEFSRYMNEYIYPMQAIRKNKILARKIWVKKYGFISKGMQYCTSANYNCKICLNRADCEITRKYNKDAFAMKKMSKMMKLLYGNLNQGYWANMAEKQIC